MKKLIAILMVCAMLFALCACTAEEKGNNSEASKASADYSKIKFGLICLHDENSTYDNNFIQALKDTQKALGLSDDQVLIKTNIEEGAGCYDTAAELVDEGCNIIFADSFGHEEFMIQAAKEFPEVQFCHATGTKSQVVKLDNYHNAFASIYEGRFLAGVVAGLKIQEMIDAGKITADQAKMGYVGAWPYAEVISGYTSFYLGAKYIVPSVTMEVTYTNSWFDIAKEKEGALALIKDGCVLVSQHADSEGAPKACEENNIPNVAYNINTAPIAPTTALISSKINWSPYYEMVINAVNEGKTFETDWCGTIATGSVQLTELNATAAAEGTQAKIDEIKAKIEKGEINVFDTANFTVSRFDDKYNTFKKDSIKTDADGHVTSYLADVVDEGDYIGETEVIANGCFSESGKGFRSAPYFDLIIDGITLK